MQNTYEYDVVLSFAGEDRPYVETVASILKSQHIKIFYDEFEQVKLWGKDLYEYLDDIYRKKGRYCIMFISKHYALKAWPTHERKSAQARAIESNREYILPARFDDTEIPGVLPTTHYIDLTQYTPEDFSKLVIDKLKDIPYDKKVTPLHPNINKVATVFQPSPVFDATLSEIEDTALQSMLTIVTNNYGRKIHFPYVLRGGFFQKTNNRILYQADLATGFSNYSIQDSLSLNRNGILETIQIYKWEKPIDNLFDLDKTIRQTIYSFEFVRRWLNSLSTFLETNWDSVNVSLEVIMPKGTMLFDNHGFVDTQIEVARFQSDTDSCNGNIILKNSSDHINEVNKQITRLLNFILNCFEFSAFGKKSFARVSEEAIVKASDFLLLKLET